MASVSSRLDRGSAKGVAGPPLEAGRTKRAKNGLLYVIARALLGLLGLIPAAWLPRVLQALGRLAAHLARRERGRALRNLAASDLQLRGVQARRVWVRLFAHVGRSLGECLVLFRGGERARALRARVSFAPGSLETLRSAVAGGRGVVFAGAHFGNWELLASTLARQVRLHVLARPSYDPRFSRLLERLRARLGYETIWVRGGRSHLRPCLAALSRGDALAFAVDQPAPPEAERVAFLGRLAPMSTVASALAHRSGAALLLVLIEREGARHCIVIESVAVETELARGMAARRASGILAERLGEAVTRRPDLWLWSLDRWREGNP